MQTSSSTEKEKNKGNWGQNYAERREFWQKRDAQAEQWVDKYEVLTTELLCALYRWTRTAENLKLANRILQRLVRLGRVNAWEVEDATYFVTLKISLRRKQEQKQLAHKYMGARLAVIFELNWQAGEYTYIGGRECWNRGGTVIPDQAWLIQNCALFDEDETGRSEIAKATTKPAKYWTMQESLKQTYGFTDTFWVLFNCKDPSWIPKIATAVRLLPPEAWGLFLLVEERKLDPFNPVTLRKPVFFSPKDMQYHHLLED